MNAARTQDEEVRSNGFCGESPFWNSEISWNSADPDVSLCFQDVVSSLVPSLYLLVAVAIRCDVRAWPKIWRRSRRAKAEGFTLHRIKQLCIIVVVFSTLFELRMIAAARLGVAPLSTPPSFFASTAPVLDRAMLLVALVLVGFLTSVSRFDDTIASSSVVFFFWLLHFPCHLLRLQHHVRAAAGDLAFFHEELETEMLGTVALTTTASLLSLSLNLGKSGQRPGSPFDMASAPSRWTLSWISPLLWKGFKKALTMEDLYELPREMKIDHLMRKFYEKCEGAIETDYFKNSDSEREKTKDVFKMKTLKDYGTKDKKEGENKKQDTQRPRPLLIKVLWKCHAFSFLFVLVLRLLFVLIELAKPLALSALINHASHRPLETIPDDPLQREWRWKGLLYVAVLFFLGIFHSFVHNFFWFQNNVLGLAIRTSVSVAIFEKSLAVSAGARQSSTVGEIMNLMSVDARTFFDALQLFTAGLCMPIHLILAVMILHSQIGVAAFAGVGCFALLVPLNALLCWVSKRLQEKFMMLKDERVKTMAEILNGIKVIKLYAWEESFMDRVARIRWKETEMFKKKMLVEGFLNFVFNSSPIFISIVSFAAFVLSSTDNVLTAEKAFVSLAILNSIRIPLWILPQSLLLTVQMYVSCRRIDAFIASEEIRPNDVSSSIGGGVKVVEGSFAWRTGEDPFLKNLSFELRSGEMLAIVGRVGAGKSALLKAILGEMVRVSGDVVVPEKIAYVSQQPWIRNETVKKNILFGGEMNRARYDTIIDACALKPDLEILPAGDKTEIGERGINLSGGQKLRVSLARALYSDADLYLLDDPLSAVDAHVGKHIFESVLSADGMLGKKSRIVVTNVLTYLPSMDNVLCLSGGRISEIGIYSQLIRNGEEFSTFFNDVKKNLKSESLGRKTTNEKEIVKKQNETKLKNDVDGKLNSEEYIKSGYVGIKFYLIYLRSMGWALGVSAVATLIIWRSLEIMTNFRLAAWTNVIQDHYKMANANQTELAKINFDFLKSFIYIGLCSTLFNLVGTIFHSLGVIAASRRLHDELTSSVLACPMSFFDTTPTGRILNRFSVDMNIIDAKISVDLFETYKATIFVIGALLTIAVVKPWFFVAIPFVIAVFIATQQFYIRSARQLRRLEATTLSPIFSMFGETLHGLSVIRAFKMQSHFRASLRSHVAINLKAAFLMCATDNWVGLVMENQSSFIVLFCALYSALEELSSLGETGLSLTYALAVVQMFLHQIRIMSVIENDLVAIERVREYSILPPEAAWRNKFTNFLVPSWPETGEVEFHNYSARYRDNLDLVLKNLNFRVAGGQRIGVVGRTGAGKSSLTLALFRVIEAASGGVEIDGQGTASLGLHDVRSKISIIPQDPVVFSGTLRTNLDPFDRHEDGELWRVLSLAHLRDFVANLPEGLDHECIEAGENLSVGQRQLVCLARALLRDSKILVLDEATAAVDSRTDALIQKTIREEFVGATVLTIAHRIDTVVDYDKVMVLYRGEVVEFEDPRILIRDEKSAFYELAKDSGILS